MGAAQQASRAWTFPHAVKRNNVELKRSIKEELDAAVCACGVRMRRHQEERAACPHEKGREFC